MINGHIRARIEQTPLFNYLLITFTPIFEFIGTFFRLLIPTSSKSLNGEVILVTGPGNGIGRSICLEIAKNHKGAKLVCWDIDKRSLTELIKDLRNIGVQAYPYTVDLTNPGQIHAAAEKVRSEVGNITMVVNNAGINYVGTILEVEREKIETIFKVNILSHFTIIQEFLPSMIERDHGHIVSISSTAGLISLPDACAYSATKHGVHAIMDSLRAELDQHPKRPRISVTTVYPYFVKTKMTANHTFNTRIPFISKEFMEPEIAARMIVEGVRKNRNYIYVPYVPVFLAQLISLFPVFIRIPIIRLTKLAVLQKDK